MNDHKIERAYDDNLAHTNKYIIPMFTSDGNNVNGECKCPLCGCPNLHIEKPQFIDGEDSYMADWGGRGDKITIPMLCEEGCKFNFCFGFHKGSLYPFIEHRKMIDVGNSKCPICKREWLVTPVDDCLLPSCGCYGNDAGKNNPNRPCETCGMIHYNNCGKQKE